jgi:hypothetical protein
VTPLPLGAAAAMSTAVAIPVEVTKVTTAANMPNVVSVRIATSAFSR